MFARITVALTLAAAVQAIQITQPSNTTGWETSGSQVIKWDSVSTDPSNFTITISQPNDSTKTPIQANVQTSDGQYTYTPTHDLSAGDGYRLSFTSENGGILAQSDEFSVAQGTSSATPTSSQTLATSSAATTTGSSASTTGAASGTESSAAASSSAPSSGAGKIAVPSVLLLVAGAFAALA
ncbi:hypothetical protein IAT38_002661 [Cryptococcus sp. DSM 104549]